MSVRPAPSSAAVRYGTMRDNVLALQAVMADGTVIRTGTRARKSSVGYDLTLLLLRLHGTDASVAEQAATIQALADCIIETRADITATGLTAPIVGHVGDGNFHVIVVFDPDDTAERERALAFHARLVARAQAMDGTCTGEHGIGYGKLDFLAAEHGPALQSMRAIKQALDPHDILNPGKTVPEATH